MHNGEILESGTHAELLAKGSHYAELHRLQFQEA
jgi:subfamily B ATP-binding cassette protein MsbA